MNNYQKLYGLTKKLQHVQMQLMDPNCNKQELMKKKDDINFEIVNYKGIVARQLMTGIWKEPHA